MNAAVRRPTPEIQPTRLTPSEAARQRLARHLGREHRFGEVLAASALHGLDPRGLAELYDYWQHDFELEQQPLFRLPSFQLGQGDDALRFVHARAAAPAALPLLLLHGLTGSLAEVASLVPQLTSDRGVAFHVVCPWLELVGASRAASAERCAELMRGLGYQRYLVHGSDSGAAVALELAAQAPQAVAGVQVTSVAAYPGELGLELATLNSAEKSQLAALDELAERLAVEPPETPLEELAFALARLADSDDEPLAAGWRDPLLTGLSLGWMRADASQRHASCAGLRLAPSRETQVPLSVHCFPVDGPSLRRFVTARHRVAEWHVHERGGPYPALEQPELLIDSLRLFGARLS